MKIKWKSLTAGILTTVAGGVGIGSGIITLILGAFIGALGGITAGLGHWIEPWVEAMPGMVGFAEYITGVLGVAFGISSVMFIAVGAVSVVFGIVAFIGGISAIKRRRWGLALTGAILSLFTMTPLGVLSIVFLSLGKSEFVTPIATAESR